MNAKNQSDDRISAASDDFTSLAGMYAAQRVERNRLLTLLPAHEYAALLPLFTPVALRLGDTLIEPEVPISYAYFVREGVGSVLAEEQEGGTIEIGTVGCEGFIGLPLLLGTNIVSHRTIVQIEGTGLRIGAVAFAAAISRLEVLPKLLLRFAQYYTDQLAQGVACNRLHTLEERCARWLLMTHDRVVGDRFALKQEYLAVMLGVRRAGVSVAMGVLQSAGIIQYSRGVIVVRDRPRLEEVSCACYHITRSAYQRLLTSAPAE